MAFFQMVEFTTSKFDEVQAVGERFEKETAGKRTARKVRVGKDRDQANRYYTLVEFDSYESAMENSNLPETQALAKEMAELCDGPPSFRNIDIVSEM
jgi:quinol monooxygenase YgiN